MDLFGLHGPDEPVYTISVAARLLGVTPQALRQLEREGILEPARTDANARLYSQNEMALLRHVCFLVRERGINIAGVKAILEMEHRPNPSERPVAQGRETVGSGAGKE